MSLKCARYSTISQLGFNVLRHKVFFRELVVYQKIIEAINILVTIYLIHIELIIFFKGL